MLPFIFIESSSRLLYLMNLQKVNSKRGRPKRKNSEEGESSEDFPKKKVTPFQPSPSVPRRAPRLPAKPRERSPGPKRLSPRAKSRFQRAQRVTLPIAKRRSRRRRSGSSTSHWRCSSPTRYFSLTQLFAEILNKANKEPEFLIMLRNLLSGCSRILRDKRSFLNKKWQNLRNSNCTQDEYISR